MKKYSRLCLTVISSSAYPKSSADISSMIEDYCPTFPPRRDGWESLKVFFQETVPEEDAVAGTVIAIQSFGGFLGFNPHLHILCSDGCFYGEGMFRVAPRFEIKQLEEIFRHNVFKMLLSKKKITEDLVDMLMNPARGGIGFQCLLWPQDTARRGKGHGKSGPIHNPCLILPGADDIFP